VHSVRVGPRDVAKLVVEHLEDIREAVELGFGFVSATRGRKRLTRRERALALMNYRSNTRPVWWSRQRATEATV
jgi:hypothetical protein